MNFYFIIKQLSCGLLYRDSITQEYRKNKDIINVF
jgi:hypothetical protein